MPAPLVRKVNATDAATTTATTVITVDATGFAAGTTLIISAFWRTAVANALTGITDSKGNTYTLDGASTSAATGIGAASGYLAVALVAGDTITLTWAGNVSGRAIQIAQYSGLVTAAPRDGAGVTAALTGTTVNGAAVTTANANDLVLEFFGTTSNVTVLSNAAGWTTTGAQASLAGPTKLDSIYQEFSATGTYQGSVTYSGASASGRQISIAYKVAASALTVVAPAALLTLDTAAPTASEQATPAAALATLGTGVATAAIAAQTTAALLTLDTGPPGAALVVSPTAATMTLGTGPPAVALQPSPAPATLTLGAGQATLAATATPVAALLTLSAAAPALPALVAPANTATISHSLLPRAALRTLDSPTVQLRTFLSIPNATVRTLDQPKAELRVSLSPSASLRTS